MHELSDAQRALLDEWLGEWRIVDDLSWPLQETRVLRVKSYDDDLIVKASEAGSHILREIPAHQMLGGVDRLGGRIPTLRHASTTEQILVTDYLPGVLVEGTPGEWDPEVYRQAGELLSAFLLPGDISVEYLPRILDKARGLIDRATDLVDPADLLRLTTILDGLDSPAVPLAFTHGDYQPRNWLLHDAEVRVIDFGRAQWRHWTSELVRLRFAQFVGHPELESAFSAGLGRELGPADECALRIEEIAQAIGTVVWARGIGDAVFEEHGRQMIRRIIG